MVWPSPPPIICANSPCVSLSCAASRCTTRPGGSALGAREGAALRDVVGLGLVAGAPTIAGTWLGGFTYSPVLATLFLALGAGAIFQVVYEVLKLMIADAAQEVATLINVLGFALGLLIMYLTGLFVAV